MIAFEFLQKKSKNKLSLNKYINTPYIFHKKYGSKFNKYMKHDTVSLINKYTYIINHSALLTIRQMPMFYYRESNSYYEDYDEYQPYNYYKMKKYIYLKNRN